MAFTTIPAAGAKLRASVFNSAVTELRPIVARKTATETVNNSSAIQNDDELFIALEASTLYYIEVDVIWTSGATPDFKFDFSCPSGLTGSYNVIALAGAATFFGNVAWTGSASTLDGDGTTKHHRIYGPALTSSAGTMQFRWAQGTTNLSDTQVFAFSLMQAKKLT